MANGWRKSDDFDLLMLPDLIIFKSDGRLFASYRGGSCTHGGFWSLDYQSKSSSPTLTTMSDLNLCDSRGYSASVPTDEVKFQNGLLVLSRGSYFPANESSARKVFKFVPRSPLDLEATAEYSGAFIEGVPMTLDFTFQNINQRRSVFQLGAFEISIQGLIQEVDAVRSTEEVVLAKRDYGGIRLGPGEVHRDSVTIIPPLGGASNRLIVKLEFSTNPGESYARTFEGRQTYRLSIGESK